METCRLKKCWYGYNLFLAFILLVALAANAEDKPQGKPQESEQAKAITVPQESEKAKDTTITQEGEKAAAITIAQQRLQKKVSVDFRDTPIDDVLRVMAMQANIDIVKSPAVTGTVTAKLTNVPLGEALDNILAVQGYGYVATENMIRVLPRKDIIEVREKIVNKIYRINYADIKQVEIALQRFISKEGSVSASPATSNIIITDTESKIAAIDAFIKEIDRITPQILVEARIYDITHRDTLDLGVEWQAGSATTIGSTLGDNPTAGITSPYTTGTFSAPTAKTDTISTTTGALRLGFLSDDLDIDARIRAEAENINAKLLANPRILVLDNENAVFDIVREIPYKQTSTTGNTATETILFKNVGVTLTVKPHVTREGMLRLDIIPKFGVVVSTDIATHVPTVDTRSVQTIVLVKNGQTVVLGGLRKKDVAQQTNKVPLLGDLPWVGAVFRFEGEDTATSEIIVFITPRIIESPALTTIEQNAYKSTEFPLLNVQDSRAEKDAEKQK